MRGFVRSIIIAIITWTRQNAKSYQVKGEFHSVNPAALKAKSDIFLANERRVSILKTKNFGKVAYVEVGAVMVGKIVQSFDESKDFKRGDEKGYFLFGAINSDSYWAKRKMEALRRYSFKHEEGH